MTIIRPRTLFVLFCVSLLTLMLLTAPGCDTSPKQTVEEVNAQIDAADTVIVELENAILEAQITGEDPAVIAKLTEKLDKVKGFKTKVAAALSAFLENTADSEDPLDYVSEGGKSVAALLPFPWNLVAIGAAGGVALIVDQRRRKLKADAKSLVKAIEEAKDPEGTVNFRDSAVDLRSRMSDGAKALVESARAEVPARIKPLTAKLQSTQA